MGSSYPVLLLLRAPLKTPQNLQDHLENELHSKFEIAPRGTKLIEKIHSRGETIDVTAYLIYFTKLAIAEVFIHFDISSGKKERMFENRDVPDYQNAFSSMVASTRLVYIEGGDVSDVESHVQATLEDAAHGQCSSLFKWTRRCSNNCWFMELMTEELADLLVYRCNKQRQSLFLFRIMEVAEVVPEVTPLALESLDPRSTSLASLAEAEKKRAEQTPEASSDSPEGFPNDTKQADTGMQIQLPVSSTLVVEVHRNETVDAQPSSRKVVPPQTSLFFLVKMHTPEVEDMLLRAMKEIRPDIQLIVEWNADGKSGHIRMRSEVEADMLMDVFLERTMEFFNDPPMRVFRHSAYKRPGRQYRNDWGGEAVIIMKGFPRGIHKLPAKAAVVELLGRAIGATKTTVTNFYMRDSSACVGLRYRTTVDHVLEQQHKLVLCGRTLVVERAPRVREFPWENRLSRSNSRDREDNRGRESRMSRSNSRDRGTYDSRRHRNYAYRGMHHQSRNHHHHHGSSSREPERPREDRFSRRNEFDRQFSRRNEFDRHRYTSRRTVKIRFEEDEGGDVDLRHEF